MCQRYPNPTSASLPESQHTCCTSLPSKQGFLRQGVVVVSCDIIHYAFAFTSSMERCYLSLLHDGIWCIALTIRQWWMLPSGLAKPVCFGQCSLEIVWSQPASPPVVKSQHAAWTAKCGGGLWLLWSAHWSVLSILYLSKTSQSCFLF